MLYSRICYTVSCITANSITQHLFCEFLLVSHVNIFCIKKELRIFEETGFFFHDCFGCVISMLVVFFYEKGQKRNNMVLKRTRLHNIKKNIFFKC